MRSVLKNKRGGDLVGPEFIKFIIAAIVIFFLIYLGARLIGIFTNDSEYETAKLTVEEISKLINSMNDGDVKTYLVEGPRSKNTLWVIFFKSENEICVCPISADIKDQNSNCNQKGVCQVVTKTLKYYDVQRISIDKTPLNFKLTARDNAVFYSYTQDYQSAFLDLLNSPEKNLIENYLLLLETSSSNSEITASESKINELIENYYSSFEFDRYCLKIWKKDQSTIFNEFCNPSRKVVSFGSSEKIIGLAQIKDFKSNDLDYTLSLEFYSK